MLRLRYMLYGSPTEPSFSCTSYSQPLIACASVDPGDGGLAASFILQVTAWAILKPGGTPHSQQV